MRLYLSSFRFGDAPERLVELTGCGKRVVVLGNALDAASREIRAEALERECRALTGLGYAPTELDLRDFFGSPDGLAAELAASDMVWVRGGNAFVLRAALALSGADRTLGEMIRSDAVVYGGYSAGCCVLAPSLRGLELVDDPTAVGATYGTDVRWDGIGVLNYAFVPHFRSEHPESHLIEAVVTEYERTGVVHRTLRDGEVIVVDERTPPITSAASTGKA